MRKNTISEKPDITHNCQTRTQRLSIENELPNEFSLITKENNEHLTKLKMSNQENQNLNQELDKALKEIVNLTQLREKQEIQLKRRYDQQMQDEISEITSKFVKEYKAKLDKYDLDLRSKNEEISKLVSQHEKDKAEWMCKLREKSPTV